MNKIIGLALLRTQFSEITGMIVETWLDGAENGGDVRLRAGGKWFAVEFKAAATLEQIGSAIQRLRQAAASDMLPLLVVPYMGDAGRRFCRSAGIAWLDLSGNADIVAPFLRIRILCEPNRFKRPGRPSSLFAARSARLARVLLLNSDRPLRQVELVRATGLSSGFVSRLLPGYEEAGFIERKREGRRSQYHIIDPDALLDAWRAAYEFDDHTILRGHVAARGGTELLRELTGELVKRNVDYAATGLAGAWLWEPFAAFRTVTLYLANSPDPELLAVIGFQAGERGSNTWLVVPADEGVFTGAEYRSGVRCVSPVQVYLDLKSHPERADEAAVELRRLHLAWSNHKGERELP